MTALLEKKILSALLDDLEIIKRLPLSVRWFEDQEHRQLADVLINSEKTYVDKSELLFDVKQKYPQSKLYLEWLEDLQFEFFETPYKELKGACKTLESEYVNRKVLKANQDYMNLPNLKNKQNLQDWLLRLDELSVEEDDGSLNTAINEFQHEIEHGKEMGLSSFKQLDQLLGAGFEPNTLNVIGARPAVGKTAFAINLVIEILKKTPDVQIDFFTLEMSKVQMLKRFTSRLTQINSYKFRDPEMTLTEDEVDQIFKAHDWITKTGLRIHDKCKKYHQIERMIRQRKLANKDKKYIAVIDYLGIIEPPNEQLPRHQQIGQMTRRLKNMTNDLMVPIIVLSQLNRGIEHRQENRPNLADLRESGDVEQDASMIGFLFNKDADKDEFGVPHSDGRVIFNVAKNREGNVGDIEFEFIKNRMTFKEWLE